MSDTPFLLRCIALIAVEIQHLEWIAWNHGDCRKHGVKNKECRYKARVMLWL